MSGNFIQNQFIRSLGIRFYRYIAALQAENGNPKIFINSLPKAGTHLLTSILEEVPGFSLSRLHIDPWDINLGAGQHLALRDFMPDYDELGVKLKSIKGGQVVTGHLPWRKGLAEQFLANGFSVVHLDRDKADVLVSRYHYISGLKRHHLHAPLMNNYSGPYFRIKAMIDGFDPTDEYYGTDSFKEYVGQFSGWINERHCFNTCFENLVGKPGGGSDEVKIAEVCSILSHVYSENISLRSKIAVEKSAGKKTATLRSGKLNQGRNFLVESGFSQGELDDLPS